MTDFTTRNPGLPPTRHKPGTMGADAAAQGVKSGSRQGGKSASDPSRGGVTSPSRQASGPGGGGKKAATPPPPEQSDFRHAILAAQYQNMRGLGRDIPFGVSLILNGHYRDILPPGGKPFDLFLDS